METATIKTRVYSFVYGNVIRPQEPPRLVMIHAPTFEEAQSSANDQIAKSGVNVNDFMIMGYTSLDVSVSPVEILNPIPKKEIEEPQPVAKGWESIVHSLSFARDRFASTKSQRSSIDFVIENIKKHYGNSNTTTGK